MNKSLSLNTNTSLPNVSERTRRAADVAYDAIERMLVTLQLAPGSAVSHADIIAQTHLGRTPVREALVRMISIGLIVPQPRRGLLVSSIDLPDYLDLLQTRRTLENLIANYAARRTTSEQRQSILKYAAQMERAAKKNRLDEYMVADHALDMVVHQACQNKSAVKAITPLIVQCRRFWYAYHHTGEMLKGAQAHMHMAQGIASSDAKTAIEGTNQLMDYLEQFARKVVEYERVPDTPTLT